MRLARDNHMVDVLAPDRSDQPFGKAILPRRGWCSRLSPYLDSSQPDRKEPKAFILRRDPEGRSAGRSLDHTDMQLHLHRGGREPSAALLRSGVRRRFATGYATVQRFFVDPQTQLDQRPTGHLIAIMETASRR
jgi:hypothetical protein